MARLAYRLRGRPEDVLTIELSGFINAATLAHFEEILRDAAARGARRVVLDFYNVNYINSTGIGAILAAQDDFRARSGSLVIIRVPQEVGLTMHLLGLTRMVAFLKSKADALAYLRGATDVAGTFGDVPLPPAPGKPAPAPAAATAATGPAAADGTTKPGRRQIYFFKTADFRPRPDAATVLMVVPQATTFTDVLRMRLESPKGKVVVARSVPEALALLDTLAPDLLILEHTVARADELVSRIKTDRQRGLCSVLKLYPRGTAIERLRDWKIWENDFLVEPFEVGELFALADAELRRVPRDRRVYLQQVHVELRGRPEYVQRAQELVDALVRASGLGTEAATATSAAFREAVDNGLRHGNRGDPDRTLDVVFLLDRRQLTITVEDQGEGFEYEPYLAKLREADPQAASRERRAEGKAGGLGILLMAKCVDRLEYLGKGNVVRLTKRLPDAPAADGQG